VGGTEVEQTPEFVAAVAAAEEKSQRIQQEYYEKMQKLDRE
jgi:hypothetical protein